MGYKKRGEARFVERIGLSTERSTNSSLQIGDLLLPSTSFFADPRFLGFSRLTCASKPSRACLHAPALYIYNNVTHTPRVRLFLLFRPVARGACLRRRG